MTYNTHSSIGTDGKRSPQRIADVINEYAPDIIALQELDIGLRRSGGLDQAQFIAEQIKMDFHFHPTLYIEEGRYGNAVLSHFPMRLIRAELLPGLPHRTKLEKRGALWVEVMVGNEPLQVVTVHMGLNRKERLAQALALVGPEWLGSQEFRPPAILCGDLNALPFSAVHRIIRTYLHDAQSAAGCRRPTWPSRMPLFRVDYIFSTEGVVVDQCLVPRTRSTRLASDHLPVVARLKLSAHDRKVPCA